MLDDSSICHFRGVGSILSLFLFLMENHVNKLCRPLSDPTLCGIYSGAALFAFDPFYGFPGMNGLNGTCRKSLIWNKSVC